MMGTSCRFKDHAKAIAKRTIRAKTFAMGIGMVSESEDVGPEIFRL